MPPLPPRDGVAAPPCAGIRAGASTVSPDDSPDGVVGVQVSPYQQRAEHDAIGGLSGTFGIAFPSLLRALQEHGGGGVYTSTVPRPIVWVVGTRAHVIWGVNTNIFPSPSQLNGGGGGVPQWLGLLRRW